VTAPESADTALVEQGAPAAAPSAAAPDIRVEGVVKRFGSQTVLRGLDLQVRAGELMVIIGRSGGGKSVLLRLMLRLIRPDAGRILIGDDDVTALRRHDLDRVREHFGVVFQGGALFDSLSVLENVLFPLREKSLGPPQKRLARAHDALARVGLADMGHKFPAEISGGMRKRVAIARALVTEPRVVFLDEPTTGLDPVLVNSIHYLIVELHRTLGFTGVMVSHEIPEIFRIAQRVAVLAEGRIRAVGTPAEIEDSTDSVVRQFIRGEVELTPS
jgi:phospholipid/cholesterol/gamma-HCH transport system ATP-binding protein